VLEWADGTATPIELPGDHVTLGREAEAVDVVVDGPGVSRLHARIRRDDAGAYWLYDEGSAAGTFLNYEQLGLAPRPLQHGDVVQLGRVTLRFRLELAGWAGRAAPEPPNTEEWHADDADFTDRRG
jgi:predicted component of type VI protein secretion system